MGNVSRLGLVVGALLGALALGTGAASAGTAPAGYLAAPGDVSKCVVIKGATGCYKPYGDIVYAFDTAADGHHVDVAAFYDAGDHIDTKDCTDFKGNGTSTTCNYNFREHTTVCLRVHVMEGDKIVRMSGPDSSPSTCFSTT